MEPTMCMKTQGLRGNTMPGLKILSDSIKSSYIGNGKAKRGKNAIIDVPQAHGRLCGSSP
jgi:hypothetical protein